MATRAPRRQKQTQKKLPLVVIYSQKDMPSHYSKLRTIAERAPKIVNITETFTVTKSFTLRELFADKSQYLGSTVRSLVSDEELRRLVPEGAKSVDVHGYVTELRCLGYYNTSPVVLYGGFPELARMSWTILKVLSPGSELPLNIEEKLKSSDPFMSVICMPCTHFDPNTPVGRALAFEREEHGVHLLSTQKDGEIMTHNAKMTEAIQECIGVMQHTVKNTFIKNEAQRTVYTPGDSLLAAVVKSFPENVQYLAWNDKDGAVEFDHTTPVMLRVPEKVANFAIKVIHQRKQNIESTRKIFANTEFGIQAPSSHGNWYYDDEELAYIDKDTGEKYNADQPFEATFKFEVTIRYVAFDDNTCAVSCLSSQFYPVPVWRFSDFDSNGEPKSADVKPYPGSLTEDVRKKWKKLTVTSKRAAEDMTESEESTAASSSPVTDD